MTPDILSDAVNLAAKAVKSAMPSQAPAVAVSGVRKSGTGSRPVRGLLTSIVLQSGFDEPILDRSSGTSRKSLNFLVPKAGDGAWFDVTDPQEGDLLTLEDGTKFAITTVAEVRGVYFKIGARQC